MTTSIIQTSFSRGEIGPQLFGRVDLAAYQNGLKQLSNYIVTPYGGFVNRAGSYFIAQTLNNEVARLIRFKFNNADAYALEFTHLAMRVYRNGGLVLNTAGPNIGLPFTLVTPFTRDELFSINFTQSGDVMDMVQVNHKPQKLKRFAHDNWTITPVSLVPSVAAPASATATTPGGGTGNTQVWKYQITAVLDDGSNSIEESLPVTSNSVTVFNSNVQATVIWPAVVGAAYYNVYKDNAGSGIYGFVGKANALTFTDNNIAPTKTDTPPTGTDPFIGAGNFPRAVGYYQQRLAYAATLNKPQTLWFSKTGVFMNFGYSTPQKDDDAITWTLASNEVNTIMHLVPLKSLLPFTDGAEWLIQGSQAGFTAKTINGDAQSYNGIGQLRPLLIGTSVVYAQERGREVTAFGYSLQADGFSGSTISILSPHLIEDYSLVDWDYQKIPYHVIWAARSDGALVNCTYIPEQDVNGWSHQHTDGRYTSVCSVPEGRDDAVYVCVERDIGGVTKRYIERFANRIMERYRGTPIISRSHFVDCGLVFNGANMNPATTLTITGGTNWQSPETLTATASTAMFAAGDVGDMLQYTATPIAEPFRFKILAYTSPTVVQVQPLGVVPPEIRGVAFNLWAFARDTFTGLAHLEGKVVSVLADGNVAPQQVVTGGAITIPDPSAIVHIGLPYRSLAETLPINIAGQETLLDKPVQVASVSLLLKDSRGGKVGSKETSLFDMKQRSISDNYGSMAAINGLAEVSVSDTWENTGCFFIVQDDPLPMNVIAAIPRDETGGKL
jgi:hypothetical protein